MLKMSVQIKVGFKLEVNSEEKKNMLPIYCLHYAVIVAI